jgi:hydrogenase maturation factor
MRGKIDPLKLNELVFPFLGVEDDALLIGPQVGEDAAVLDLDACYLVISSDPITGARENIGRYAVHINANDIATMGAVPRYFLPVLLLKEGSGDEGVKKIMSDIDRTCKDLHITVIGGHSEITSHLKEDIISASILGIIQKNERIITSSGARAGDLILLTNGAGIEGTSILAHDRSHHLSKMDPAVLERAKEYVNSISIVQEALIARRYATAMHDPTEGGVLGGIHEICDASGKGFSVDPAKIPVRKETELICTALDIDPLALIGSGALLITCPENDASALVNELNERGIENAVIGVVKEDHEERNLPRVEQDEIWRFV